MANDNDRKNPSENENALEAGQRPESGSDSRHDSENGQWEEVEEGVLPGEYSPVAKEDQAQAGSKIETDYSRRIRAGIIVILITFVGLGGWAALAPLDGAAIAPGKVIVNSENRSVQHLQGGIVSEILVRDGDRVERSEKLVLLSDTQARAELNIVESQLLEAVGREARLQAERVSADTIDFPEALLNTDSAAANNIVEGQRALFRSRTDSIEGQIAIYRQRIEALNQQMQGLGAMNDNLAARIDSYRNEVANWQELFEQELADRTRINEMQRELFRLQGERAGNESRLAELKIKVGETRSELLVTRENYAEEVSKRLREVQQNIADLRARRVALSDTLDRTVIRAPATGTVVGMTVHTEGGVIKPGETILEIVPTDQDFTISARVQTPDIDRVKVGQKADVRLSAFSQQTNDVIPGQIVRLSADSFEDEQSGEQYYEARVSITDEGKQTMSEQGMYMVPGMPAEVMIKTGERTALQYLLDPVTRMFDRALREE